MAERRPPSPGLPTLDDVRAASQLVYAQAVATPLLRHPALDEAAGCKVTVKAESLQTTGSFKIRGAMNRLANIAEVDRPRGIVAFSSGNHAQGIARAARHFGMPATIVMPADAPQVKCEGVRANGAEIVFYDRDTESREAIAERIARETGAVLVPSFDDPWIMAGQGTAGLEFADQLSRRGETIDHLICCTGGGGLISGMALAFEGVMPETRLWTAEPIGFEDWQRSLEAGQRLANAPGGQSICDAILTPEPGKLPFEIARTRLSGGFAVSDGDVRAAMRFAFRHLKLVVEPGGAVALATVLRGVPEPLAGRHVGVMLTGGNVDAGLFAEVIAGG